MCLDLAGEVQPDQRGDLILMAETWRRLAEDAERFDALVRDLDSAFATPNPRELDASAHQRSH